MKIFRTRVAVLAASLAVPVLLALARPADEIAFHPKADEELKKELKLELELRLEDIAFEVDGQSQGGGDMLGDQDMIVSLLVGVTEKYVATKDGHPTDLLRTFDDLELTGEFGDEKKPAEKFDDLEGRTVRFKWNDESKGYDRSFHDSKGEDSEIENLLEDMDLRVLLPDKKVSDGDTWEVAGEKLAPLFLPGGVPGSPGDDDDEKVAMLKEELESELAKFLKDFKVTCKYAGARQEGDTRVGAIEIKFEGRADIDLSKLILRIAEEEDPGVSPEVNAKAGFELKGDGELLWNLAAGRVHAFEMQSDVAIHADVQASIDAGGENHEISASGRLAGKATWSLTTSSP